MARDGAGSYSRDAASPATGQTISSTNYNTELNSVASALTASIAKDGQTAPTANLPMGTYKHTGVAAASGASRTEYVSGAVEQDGGTHWAGTAGGTANALTIAPTPAIAAYAAGQVFRFISGAAANTSTVTLAVSGLTTKAVQKNGTALAADDIAASKTYEVVYDGTAFQIRSFSGATPTGGDGIAVSAANVVSLDINELSDTAVATGDFLAFADASDSNAVKKAGPRAWTRAGRSIAVLADQKAQNTDGGTFTSGAWRTRDLQTEVSDVDAITSITSNEFTLQAGTYHIRAVAPSYQVAESVCRLYNVTDASVVATGTNSRSAGTSQTQVVSEVETVVTIAGAKAFKIEHICVSTGTTTGFGIKTNLAAETYTVVRIERIA